MKITLDNCIPLRILKKLKHFIFLKKMLILYYLQSVQQKYWNYIYHTMSVLWVTNTNMIQ